MFRDLEDLRAQIRQYKLDRLENNIIQLAMPSIAISRTLVDENSLPLGTSKLGGHPDLPSGYKWPDIDKKPLTFIGQFSFSEIAPYDQSGLLPKRGILFYFYDVDSTPWGSQDQKTGWHVFYLQDENTLLQRTDHPIAQGEWIEIKALTTHRLSFSSTWSLPRIFLDDRHEYNMDFIIGKTKEGYLDSVEHNAYWKLVDNNYPAPRHHFLGHPIRWQDKVEREVVIYSQNIQTLKNPETNLYYYSDEQLKHISDEMEKWVFLFQIDQDGSMDIILNYGTIYICIPKASLAARRFEDCWTILQCT